MTRDDKARERERERKGWRVKEEWKGQRKRENERG